MESAISQGVLISVEHSFLKEYSNVMHNEFMYSYRITIQNNNTFTIQLLQRHWHIFDSNFEIRQVQGEGVVGVQPIIQPNQQYSYISNCNLNTDIGKMHGKYNMKNLYNNNMFEVKIPSFNLIYPPKYN